MKVCGITTVEDALMCADAGVDAIGLNFWPKSVRRCEESVGAEIVRALGGHVRTVGVFVDATTDDIRSLRKRIGFEWVQLHGNEPPEQFAAFAPESSKAIRVGAQDSAASVIEACSPYRGEHVLLDASVPGMPGGTGKRIDWQIARAVADAVPVLLAGGLTPHNVVEAVRTVTPWGVDAASGVEASHGKKDEALVRAFVSRARTAGEAAS